MPKEKDIDQKPRRYKVKLPLRHDKKDYAIGSSITLTPAAAEAIGAHVLDIGTAKEEEES